jgi:GntR family transcriptional regulator, transcriptional repressor for pyruvate dehydrogenase complex
METSSLKGKKSKRVSSELFVPVTTRAAFEDVARQIVDLIEKGQLKEGYALPGERVLATAMEVSRPTIRLAVSTLVKDGVLAVTPGAGGGTIVRSRWIPEVGNSSDVELEAEEIFELLEARRVIEPRVAQLAATRGTSAEFEAMREALELQKAHLDDRSKAFQAERHFHRLLWQAGRNRQLETTLVRLFGEMGTAFDMAMRTAPDKADAVELNRETLNAVTSGDLDAVEVAMDRHMGYLERIVEEAFGRKRIREVPSFLVTGAAD